MDAEEFNRPYWLLPHHFVSNEKPKIIPCVPSTVEHDNCLWYYQLLVSAMMNEINCDVTLHSTCWINVVECLFIGKDLFSSMNIFIVDMGKFWGEQQHQRFLQNHQRI